MRTSLKKLLSLLLVLTIVVSMFAGLITTANAATFSYNTGKRGTLCTSLSSKATAYYTGSYVYSTLSAKTASTIKSSLQTLMTDTHATMTTYADLKTYTKYSDAYNGSSSEIVDFYSSDTYSGTWDNAATWNREHVWCQSLGSFTTSDCGSDLHHLRPTDPKLNSTRSNLPFGEVSGSYKTATSNSGAVGGYYTSTCFEPLDNVKGDVARILLYCYVRWGESNLSGLISTTDLLNWMKSDPVDTYEMGRNDVVQGIQGNRNVFIDYPEYAWLIMGKSVPSHSTPSGMAAGGSSSSDTTTPTTYTVTASTNNSRYGTVSVSGYTITATPKTGYKVSSYTIRSGSATVSQNGNVFTVTPSSNCSIRINFAKDTSTTTYTVTASTNNSNYGTVSVSGYTIIATPNTGYKVSSYSIRSGSATVSQNGNVFTVTPSSNCSIRINFAKDTSTTTYTVTASSNNSSYGTVSVSGYTITATPNTGYKVNSYSILSGTATVSQSGNVFTVTPSSNCSIRINFAKDSSSTSSGATFTRVTSTSSLTSGTYVLVVKVGTGKYPGSSTYYALTAQSMNTSYVAATSADSFMGTGSAPSTITVSDSKLKWTLSGTSSGFTLKSGSYYLRGSSNNLYYNSATSYTTWKATVSSGVWTIKNGTRYLALRPDLQLGSNGCPRFRCNSTASSTNYQFYLYKLTS